MPIPVVVLDSACSTLTATCLLYAHDTEMPFSYARSARFTTFDRGAIGMEEPPLRWSFGKPRICAHPRYSRHESIERPIYYSRVNTEDLFTPGASAYDPHLRVYLLAEARILRPECD